MDQVRLVMRHSRYGVITVGRSLVRALRSISAQRKMLCFSLRPSRCPPLCTTISSSPFCHRRATLSCPNPTCRYIKWVQQAYRSGGAKAQLLPLLERCTRELEALPRYRSDHRYLRLWILYVSQHLLLGPACAFGVSATITLVTPCWIAAHPRQSHSPCRRTTSRSRRTCSPTCGCVRVCKSRQGGSVHRHAAPALHKPL